MRFKSKVAIVTGASMGIGKAAALAFVREGATAVIVATDRQHADEVLGMAQSEPGEAHFIQADVSRDEEVRATFDEIVTRWDRLDVLVNNAGIYVQGDAISTSLKDWERILAVNLTGPFLCTKYAVPAMIKSGGGVIVNIGSEAGLVGIRNQVAYNVSKGGVIALTRSCAVDLAQHGIRVNCVCPGTTDTPLVQAAVERAADPVQARKQLKVIRPLNRLGSAEEIASAVLYLASQEAAYATGSIFSMDGGYTAQ